MTCPVKIARWEREMKYIKTLLISGSISESEAQAWPFPKQWKTVLFVFPH